VRRLAKMSKRMNLIKFVANKKFLWILHRD
jgi:hypothetical protein